MPEPSGPFVLQDLAVGLIEHRADRVRKGVPEAAGDEVDCPVIEDGLRLTVGEREPVLLVPEDITVADRRQHRCELSLGFTGTRDVDHHPHDGRHVVLLVSNYLGRTRQVPDAAVVQNDAKHDSGNAHSFENVENVENVAADGSRSTRWTRRTRVSYGRFIRPIRAERPINRSSKTSSRMACCYE
jgi:hypothetical protein